MNRLEKQRYILDFALSSMNRRKGKNIALVAVYAFVLFLLASVLFSADALKQEAAEILQDAPEMTVQRLVAGRQDLVPTGYVDSIRKIRGVQSVEPRLWGYYYDSLNGANYTLMVNNSLKERNGQIVIGTGVAQRSRSAAAAKDIRLNSIMPFKAFDGSVVPLKVRGMLPSASELISADLVLTSEDDFRKIFGIAENLATDLVLKVRNSRELATIANKIVQLFPDTRPILRDEILRTYAAIFDWRGGVALMVLSGTLFAFIILAWDKATGLNAEERREIGVLKAVGWETSDILLMKFWEGTTVSLTAFFIGVVLAYLHIFFGSALLFEPVLKGWSTLYPHFRLTPSINIYQIASLFFLTVLPYTVITIVPSWRSATIDPDAIMRA